MNTNMIMILGVTASGKGRLAFDLAEKNDADIISVDSMKVYRRMDIGTAKPSLQARQKVKYHLIDVAQPSESFSVGTFVELTAGAIEQIKFRNKPVVAVGGTALYIKALLYGLFEGPGGSEKIRCQLRQREKTDGLAQLHSQLARVDPDAADRIHPNDSKRIIRALEVYQLTGKPISQLQQQWDSQSTKHNWTIIGLRREKEQESKRINARVKKMIDQGLVDEVENLLAEDQPLSKQAVCAIGYAEIINYLKGQISLEDTVELIKKNTRRFAKSQRTWFKTFKNIKWLDIGDDEQVRQILDRASGLLQETK